MMNENFCSQNRSQIVRCQSKIAKDLRGFWDIFCRDRAPFLRCSFSWYSSSWLFVDGVGILARRVGQPRPSVFSRNGIVSQRPAATALFPVPNSVLSEELLPFYPCPACESLGISPHLSRLDRGESHRVDNVVNQCPSGEVVDWAS